ncbi:ABC transporter permease [Bacillus sp. H-16]|uniref:ABC transporter permease n=1 Tax=Alteribacter salitolerans TaxID=2912333 RepID=UPI001963C3F5|nr:ABC transporter permease [Alteribacter salitolerans]MBM7095090.1 ABC transporter permease [Alteribacter salitolerans]
MKSIFLHQWQRFRRAPILVLSFFILTVVFVFTLAGETGPDQNFTVQTFVNEGVSDEAAQEWLDRLNESEGMTFTLSEEEEVRDRLRDGRVNVALVLDEADYRLIVATDDGTVFTVENYVDSVFREELRLREAEASEGEDFREALNAFMENPVLEVKTKTIEGADGTFVFDSQLQTLFGMTLFFSVYTMMYSLVNVAEEKRTGTWDRMIISPLRKFQMYTGHLVFTFTIGYAQILLIFMLFTFGFGFDIGEQFGMVLLIIGCYCFAIVALGTLLIGLVKTSQQLNGVIPIVAVAMAMLGGAFWPIEVVSNEIVLFFSQGMPILYAMDALKQIAIYERSFDAITQSLSILILFGVICMGVGINLMERRG